MTTLIMLYERNKRYSLNPLLAIALKKGVRVLLPETIDKAQAIIRDLDRVDNTIFAVSLRTMDLVDSVYLLKLTETIRVARSKNILTVAGGPHATGDPYGTLLSLGFDLAFIGEAEESFSRFLDEMRDKGDPRKVMGIAYMDNGDIVITGKPPPIDLNKYDPFPYWAGIFSPIEITRGCPYGCRYCQVSYIHGRKYRHRSVDKIVTYVQEAVARGIRDMRFVTPDCLAYGIESSSGPVRTDLIEELLSGIHKAVEGVKGKIFYGSFPSEARPDHVNSDTVRLLKKYVSNREVIIGAQSGSQRILRLIDRGHTPEDVLNAASTLAREGFIPSVDFIVGFPDETREDMHETLSLISEILKIGGRIHLHYYLPLPGTPLWPKKPSPIPSDVFTKLSKIIGEGRGYGAWLNQMKIAENIIKLYERGIIYPRRRVASVRTS